MSAQPDFTLYSFWRTSATYRVRVALNLKGITALEKNINLDTGEQRSAEFCAINPLAAIPALIQAGHPPLTQSIDRKSTRLNSSHRNTSRMPSSA